MKPYRVLLALAAALALAACSASEPTAPRPPASTPRYDATPTDSLTRNPYLGGSAG